MKIISLLMFATSMTVAVGRAPQDDLDDRELKGFFGFGGPGRRGGPRLGGGGRQEPPAFDATYTCDEAPTCDLYVKIQDDGGGGRQLHGFFRGRHGGGGKHFEGRGGELPEFETIEGGGVRICRQSRRDPSKNHTICVNATDMIEGFGTDECGCCGGECPDACTKECEGSDDVEVVVVRKGWLFGETTTTSCVSPDMSVTMQLKGAECADDV